MIVLSFTGILVFAGFIHDPLPLRLLAFGGLAWTAAIMGASIQHQPVLEAFGIIPLDRKTLIYLLPALALGISLGILTRNRFELTLLPKGLTGVALVAPLVGAAEELIFRGYFQGKLRAYGQVFSIAAASAFHTCYKLLLILSLDTALQFDFFFLIFWTFVGGLLFGALRGLSRSSIPPVLAHGLFDIFLYGGLSAAPLWVWS